MLMNKGLVCPGSIFGGWECGGGARLGEQRGLSGGKLHWNWRALLFHANILLSSLDTGGL